VRAARPRRALAAVAALALLPVGVGAQAPPPEAETPEAFAKSVRAFYARLAETEHLQPGHVDVDALVELGLKLRSEGQPRKLVGTTLTEEYYRQVFSFAPRQATPDRTLYRFPFDEAIPRLLSQGAGGNETHARLGQYFAFDFLVPRGTPVLAARAGTVALVFDGFAETGREGLGNEVKVLHSDGTFADYVHLSPGIPVREGESVEAGQRIAWSGRTGTSAVPHLHLHVAAFDPLRRPPYRTVPIRFDDGSPSGVVPEPGRFWSRRPPATAQLRVSVGGRAIERAAALRLAPRGSAQLEVALVEAGGAARDVTRDPKTLYAVGPLWTLSVSETGLVTAAPTTGFEGQPLPAARGVVTVVHRDEAREVRAYADVPVDVDRAPDGGKPAAGGAGTRR
jgi:murein DD-endopeptidase MepM/ murein hydrolase activator NlpD